MNSRFPIFHSRFFAIFLALFCMLPRARSADVEVTASLTEPSTEVGQPVQFQIKITGARSANPPARIAVDGLSISYGGQSTQVQMNNFNVTMSVVHSYQVIPQRAGKFTIPGQTVEVGGKNYAANPVTLEVGGSSTNSATGQPVKSSREIFAELVVPKQSAYVGEVVPVEFRIYVDTRIRWQPQQPPTISGDGFTVQKLTKPLQNQVQKDGRVYDLVTFKTAITPAKSGQLTLGPAELDCIANLPQQRRRNNGSVFQNFFDDDAFGDAFGFGQAQQIAIKSDPVTIDVKPLPTANQPKDFSGAVGLYSLTASAAPAKVKLGDPITLTTTISGRGNFDRVNAPQLAEEEGWRSYPPSGKFQADDDVGISGTKTFATALIPEQPKTKLPAVRFSYFDPLQEKYVTLRGDQPAIVVEGQPAPTPLQRAVASASASVPRATPAPAANDILYIRTDEARWGESFAPIYRTRGFWLAQLVPLSLLMAFAGLHLARARQRDVSAQQTAEWRREKTEAMKTLAQRDTNDTAFLDAATRCVQLAAALHSGRRPELIDAEDACAARSLDAKTADGVRALFAMRAEWRYAGIGEDAGALSQEKRAEILAAVKRFEQEFAHV